MNPQNKLSANEVADLLQVLQTRFAKNKNRHLGLNWAEIEEKLRHTPEKLWSLNEMERTEGEPDMVGFDQKNNQYLFMDCSAESPKGRRSVCYDSEALESRKEHKPHHSALGMAKEMGIEILSEQEYRHLQTLGTFDTKTSSWVLTPQNIREKGGAIFCDYRYGTVFVYHNGAESYYASRGFRGLLRV